MRRVEDQIAEVMAAEHDHPRSGPPRRSYLICSSPRVGSNLLIRALGDMGIGAPFEYLHSAAMEAYRFRYDGAAVGWGEYLDYLKARRSPAGVFGLKAHHHQVAAVLADRAAQRGFLEGFDRLILLERRDRLSQAISAYRATRSDVWFADSAEHADAGRRAAAAYDAAAIARALAFILEEAAAWEDALDGVAPPVLRIAYEDFVADLPGVLGRIVDFLGVAPQRPIPTQPMTVRIGDKQNTLWRDRFQREALGAG